VEALRFESGLAEQIVGLISLQRAEPALGRSSRRAIAGDGVGGVMAGKISYGFREPKRTTDGI
jgi:hypothetical protein